MGGGANLGIEAKVRTSSAAGTTVTSVNFSGVGKALYISILAGGVGSTINASFDSQSSGAISSTVTGNYITPNIMDTSTAFIGVNSTVTQTVQAPSIYLGAAFEATLAVYLMPNGNLTSALTIYETE